MKTGAPWIVGAVCFAAVCLPARALSAASATAGPFSFTLIDLNLADGVEPSLAFSIPHPERAGNVFAAVYDNGLGLLLDDGGTLDPWATLTRQVALPNAESRAELVTAATPVGALLQVTGRVTGTERPGDGRLAGYIASVEAPLFDAVHFTLSNNTRLVIGIPVKLAIQTSGGYDPVSRAPYEWAYARASGQLYGTGPGGTGRQAENFHFDLMASDRSGVVQARDERSFARSFNNVSGASLDGSFSLRAYIEGSSGLAAAVPESASWSLMLAGIGVLAWRLRPSRLPRASHDETA